MVRPLCPLDLGCGQLAHPMVRLPAQIGIFLSKWHKKLAGLRGKHLRLVIPVTVQG
jgi:hypothetical protein